MEFIDTILGYLDSIPGYITAILGVMAAASAITAITPTPKDDAIVAGATKYLQLGLKFINVLAMNFGKNKNADAVVESAPEPLNEINAGSN